MADGVWRGVDEEQQQQSESVLKASDWKMLIDPESGHYYYENTNTGVWQWDAPPGFEYEQQTQQIQIEEEESLVGRDLSATEYGNGVQVANGNEERIAENFELAQTVATDSDTDECREDAFEEEKNNADANDFAGEDNRDLEEEYFEDEENAEEYYDHDNELLMQRSADDY